MKLIPWLWVGLFVSPFLVLFFKMGAITVPPMNELTWVIKNSVAQAGASALLSVVFGIIGGLGLLRITREKNLQWLRVLISLPSFIPPLFVMLSMIQVLEWFGQFPFGFDGVVLVHAVMNGGLCAVIFEKSVRNKLGGMWELALVEGARPVSFYLKVLIPLMALELFGIFLFVFSLCISSFTVPLLAGDVEPLSLSIYLFNKLRLEGDWGQALFLAMLESVILFSFAFFKIKKSSWASKALSARTMKALGLSGGIWLPILLVGFVLLGDLYGLVPGFAGLSKVSIFVPIYISFITGAGVGFFIVILFFLYVWSSRFRFTQTFFKFFNSPSPVFLGFVAIILFPQPEARFTVLFFGMAVMFFPSLFRMYGHSQVEALKRQNTVAEQMGASNMLITKEIILPQLTKPVFWMAGVGAFWASGEFAFTRILLGGDMTLALLVETLLGAYALNEATAVSFLMLVVGTINLLVFIGLGHVVHKKYQ